MKEKWKGRHELETFHHRRERKRCDLSIIHPTVKWDCPTFGGKKHCKYQNESSCVKTEIVKTEKVLECSYLFVLNWIDVQIKKNIVFQYFIFKKYMFKSSEIAMVNSDTLYWPILYVFTQHCITIRQKSGSL